MSAGYDRTEERRFQIRMFNIVSGNMSFNMMYTHKRQISGISDGLSLCNAYKKRTYKTRSVCYTDRVNIIQSHTSIIQCLLDHLIDSFYMISGSDLRNYASIQFMNLDLG